MKLANEAGLAADLERGLGEIHWMAVAFDPSLRLRMPLCGLTSLAVASAMSEQGVDAIAVQSSPNLFVDPGMTHVMVKVTIEGREHLVDPTYSQFVDLAGLSPGYVIHGGEDLFPTQKIATMRLEGGLDIAKALASNVVYFRTQRQPIEELALARYPMEELTYDEIVEQFQEIWNPQHFETFHPEEPGDLEAAERLARFILPEHVRLVA